LKALLTLFGFFRKKTTELSPLLIIKKNADDGLVKEYRSIEEAISELENEKDKRSITIKNGEIVQ